MKNYELTYIVSPELPEEELKNLSGKIGGFIQEETGKVEKTTEPSKKRTGEFLISLNFSLTPDKIVNLEKKLKAENQILRYIILTKKAKEKSPRPRRISLGLTIKKMIKPSETMAHEPKAGKVELKEIDKKIEEILNE